jgi:Protein of unknown function (DUF1569)
MKTFARRDDATTIVRRLRSVQPESRARWGRMSAHQMVCHVRDSLQIMTGQRNASPATGRLQQTVIKWLALYAPMRWPPGVQTRPEVDPELEGTKPVDFSRDVAQLEALFEQVIANPRGFDRQRHPIFGPMSDSAWLRWAYLHADHHLRQFGV